MGLDCRAFERVELVNATSKPTPEEWEQYEDDALVWLGNGPAFAQRNGGLVDGFYRWSGGTEGWRAGSCSGYGAIRKVVCRLALGVNAESVWEHPDRFAGRPLVELIEFTDCDGFLGPEVCARLAEQSDSLPHITDALRSQADWWAEVWEQFVAGFKLAAHHGALVFR